MSKKITLMEQKLLEALFPLENSSTPQCPWLSSEHPTLQPYELEALNEHQKMLEELYPETSPEQLKVKVLYSLINIQELAEQEVKSWPHAYNYSVAAEAALAYLKMSHPQYGPLIQAMLDRAKSLGYTDMDEGD